MQRFINNAKEQGLRPNDIEDVNGFNRQYIELYEAYDAQCQREEWLTWRIATAICGLIQRHNEPRRHYQNRFHHILIDEFQDKRYNIKGIWLLSSSNSVICSWG